MNIKSPARAGIGDIKDAEAILLHECISALMRQFRIEPGLLVGSTYADLHANDIGLFEILATRQVWTVRQIAETLGAPMTTISSALDRLEQQGLVQRRRIDADRRVVRVEFTGRGRHLATRLRDAHIKNCRIMLSKLHATDREKFLQMAAQISGNRDQLQNHR